MKNISRAMIAVTAVGAAAGCTNLNGGSLGQTFTAEPYIESEIQGSGYNAALARSYQDLAAYNGNVAVNWLDATVYVQRSKAAAAGNPPELFMPSEYGVNGDLEALRSQTLAAIADHAAERPEECASLAANYDFLVEQTYQQPGADLALARSRYDSSFAACAGPQAPSDLTVFFAFDRATLDSVATQVVDDVISAVRDTAVAISVVGHTDTVGSVAYNQELSERRADAVADRMINMGVDAGRITQAGRSELEPAVVTGDGVREARNRRVEITISD